MTLQDNKALVAEFIEAMRTSDTGRLAELISEDFSWWIIGKPEYLATAGEHDSEFFLEILPRSFPVSRRGRVRGHVDDCRGEQGGGRG